MEDLIMEKLGLNEIREKFLSFFETKQHLRLKSFSLVPNNDKSLLLINSGMAPLKPYFTGQQIPPRKRVTTCQKCIRTGDIDNVGKTARHGTFFEMLGNFSFGDYFKKEVIPWAWEFFTEVLKIPEDRLYVSVYKDDDEAFDIWNKDVGIPENKIFRMGKDDNFWEHGVGPCGPCSEIYYDKGEKYGCGKPDCTVGCDCDRYMEIWNLVFTQFCKEEDGSYSNLDHPNIDTGMGLERIAAVMQGVDSIFDVDTIKAVRDAVCKIAGVQYNKDYKTDVSVRVITDHIRSVTFMVADGVLASNEGRGYVLRRLLRRAARHGKLLGIDRKFLSDICMVVIENSGGAYPELEEKKDYIHKIINVEEERFYETINQGMDIIRQKINEIKTNQNESIFSGAESFKLYDTYGFPIDLLREILEEEGISIDEEGFLREMENQKNRARAAREENTYMGAEETVFHKLPPDMHSDFIGYNQLDAEDCSVLAIVVNDAVSDRAVQGQNVVIISDKTPFYAEMGGQAGDQGVIKTKNCLIEITDCTRFGGNKILHSGIVKSGEIKVGDLAEFSVDKEKRIATARNHTVTHILQRALKDVLGNHIEQAGSFVSNSRLRFDFTHFEPVGKENLIEIEKIVNSKILDALDVTVEELPIEEAKKKGAMALFGEKYGDIVRVVSVGDYSVEFCGGTHLKNSAQAGSFKILSESGVAAGVRRIEALTGYGVLNFYEESDLMLENIKSILKIGGKNIINKINSLIDENKTLSKELERIKSEISLSHIDDFMADKREVNGVSVICAKVDGMEMSELRNMGDKIKDRLRSGIIILASPLGEKVSFIAMVTDDIVKKGANAGAIVKAAAKVSGGGGGGKANMAQAGGKNPAKIQDALNAAFEVIKQQL